MKVWIISPHESPNGHTSRTFDYSRELTDLGHEVTVFVSSYSHRTHIEILTQGEKCRIEIVEGIKTVWIRTFPYVDNGWRRGMNMLTFAHGAYGVAKTIKELPDVVVGESVPPAAGWVALKIANMYNSAFVYQVRDIWPIALVENGSLSKRSPIYLLFRTVEVYLYKNAHKICATMPFISDHVKNSGADPGKITWIPNGVSLRLHKSYRIYDGVFDKRLIAMYVGGYGEAHDVITIVRAARILKNRNCDNWHFVIVGDGVKRAECEEYARKHDLANIEFRNSIDKRDVPELLNTADICIASVTNSDVYRFGMNLNKIYDYFAAGRPVIFSGRTPNDPVSQSGAGFSISPEDPEKMVSALEEYLAMTPKGRANMGKLARRYAENHFDVHQLAFKMESMLKSAVNSKKVIT